MLRRMLPMIVLLAFLLSAKAAADYDPDTDYMALMIQAVIAGDDTAGLTAEESRAEKIAEMELGYAVVAYEELLLLSKVIQAEAGSEWLDAAWKMSVGEVVLNRMASPEYPDTMLAVIEQPGQYYGKDSRFFRELEPSPESVEAAKRLLSGERILCEPAVVFQSNERQGSGVFRELRDRRLGSTFLCYSNNRALYEA